MNLEFAKLNKESNIHFVGIKGVGMAALASVICEAGLNVTGSDIAIESITNKILQDKNVPVTNGFNNDIPNDTKLVIYTAAHGGSENPQVIKAREKGIAVLNYGQALGYVFRDKKVIAVSGTHGKTTTTAMLASILKDNDSDPSWIVGTGEVPTLGEPGHYGKSDLAVIEADEYFDQPGGKPKFLHLNPFGLIITSLDWDHPDVFKSHKIFINAFHKLLKRVNPKGILVLLGNQKDLRRLTKSSKQKIRWIIPKKIWPNLKLNIPGEFNRQNATFAATMAHELGVPQKQILASLLNFKGVQRRLEIKGQKNGWLIIDDYAHHPSEIVAAISAVREKYPKAFLTVVFQSHTYTRTEAFIQDFAKSFKSADCVLVAPIFSSAREVKPSRPVDLFEIVSQNNLNVKKVNSPSDLEKYMREADIKQAEKVILTMGAGDIYQWIKLD
jgi:UDP-N-acetylmuramate--alanine ligase